MLLRHGESVRNIARRGRVFYADEAERAAVGAVPDELRPLTDEGMRQAERRGRYLASRFGVFDALYHSGYVRTVSATEGILSEYGARAAAIKVRRDLFVRERDPGTSGEVYSLIESNQRPGVEAITEGTDGSVREP